MPSPPVQATLDDFELGEEVAWGSLATVIDIFFSILMIVIEGCFLDHRRCL